MQFYSSLTKTFQSRQQAYALYVFTFKLVLNFIIHYRGNEVMNISKSLFIFPEEYKIMSSRRVERGNEIVPSHSYS